MGNFRIDKFSKNVCCQGFWNNIFKEWNRDLASSRYNLIVQKNIFKNRCHFWIFCKWNDSCDTVSSGSHREKRDPLVIVPSTKAAGVNRPKQFVVLIKQLTFSENLTGCTRYYRHPFTSSPRCLTKRHALMLHKLSSHWNCPSLYIISNRDDSLA